MLPEAGNYAVAMVFLPGDDQQAAVCTHICEEMCEAEGAGIIGWRNVPIHSDCISERARKTQPTIRQLFIFKEFDTGTCF